MADAIAGAIPPFQSYLPDCPQVWLFPNAGPWNSDMAVTPRLEDYQAVDDQYDSYTELVAGLDAQVGLGEATYADLTRHTTGERPGPGTGGWGYIGGVLDQFGVESWVTKVTGWDGGPTFDARTTEGQLSGGTQVSYVLGRGREVVVSGALYHHAGGEVLAQAQLVLGAALATVPHRGWLSIDNLWLPVAMSGFIRQDRVDVCRVDYEFTLKGRDGVSPGHGVYKEKWPMQSMNVVAGTGDNTDTIMNDGVVGVPPVVEYRPAANETGSTLTVTVNGYSQTWGFNALPADRWIRLDTAHRRVTLMSDTDADLGSARGYVDWEVTEWLEVPPGESTWNVVATTAGTEYIVYWIGLF